MRKRLYKYGVLVATVSLVLLAYGCGAGYRTTVKNGHEKVFRVDEEGNKTLVYEVTKEGALKVHDKSDPRAQRAVEEQERREQMQLAKVERIERIRRAPKRKPSDPIYVMLVETKLDRALTDTEKSKGAVFDEIRKGFKNDPVIELVHNVQKSELSALGKMLSGQHPDTSPPADVTVISKGYIKEVVGINKKTGKPGKMAAVVFEATIKSNYLPAEYTVSEQGNIFRNVEVTKRFTDKIKKIIKKDIGPTVPADRKL